MASGPTATIAARLDRLPAGRDIRRFVTLLSLGGCFEFYDLFMTAYVAPGMVKSGIFAPTTKALFGLQGVASFVSSLFAGLFIGTLLVSWLSDRLGRRAVFTWSLLWYSVCTLIMAFQDTAMGVDIWRLIASIGIGVELVNIDTYLSELIPKEQRGRAFAYNQAILFTAVPVVAFLAWMLVPVTLFGLDGWRWVVIIGATGAIFIWFIRRGLPESPRWLAQHGRAAEADRLLTAIEHNVAQETGAPLPPPSMEADETDTVHGSWWEIWRAPYLPRTIILIVFQLLQTVGFYGFQAWVPSLLIAQGITVTKSLEYTFIVAICNPIGPMIASGIADRFERKWQIAVAAIAIGVFGLLFAQQTSALGVTVCGVLIVLSANWMSFAFHAYQAELYPTRIRAQAVGFVYSWSRISAVFTSFVIGSLLANFGTDGVFVFIAACMVGVALVIGLGGPRTARLRLEAIAR